MEAGHEQLARVFANHAGKGNRHVSLLGFGFELDGHAPFIGFQAIGASRGGLVFDDWGGILSGFNLIKD